MALTYLKIFADMEETLSLYSDEERGRLLSAMMAYSFRGEEPVFSGAERFIWPTIRRHIDSCEMQNEKQKANGKRGGRPETQINPEKPNDNPTKPKETQSEANVTQEKPIQEQEQEQEQEHVQEQLKSTKGKRTRFVPPTSKECDAFFRENGATSVQAMKFRLYYESNGWKVGKNPMKDWQAAARGWISRDKEGFGGGGAAKPAQPKEQMLRYTEEQRKKAYSAAIVDFDAEEVF